MRGQALRSQHVVTFDGQGFVRDFRVNPCRFVRVIRLASHVAFIPRSTADHDCNPGSLLFW